MEMLVKGPDRPNAPPVWDHFLLKDAEVRVKTSDGTGVQLVKTAGAFRGTVPDAGEWVELTVAAAFRYNGSTYSLLKIVQRFQLVRENNQPAGIRPLTWQKQTPGQSAGFVKATPPLHPLLEVAGATVTVDIDFVEITALFDAIHGDTPWYSALRLLKSTNFQVHALAALGGHPFIWYVVVPATAAAKAEQQPNLLLYPADYGGIHYVADKLDGITTPNHNTSVGNVQCGGETLFSFLVRPISDADYDAKLGNYLRLSNRFQRRHGRNPPPLHHFREVLAYTATGEPPVPKYWDVPFGFEQALSDKQQILVIPQISGGDGGICLREGLKALVDHAILHVYTHGNTLHYDTIVINKLILTGYSESGGNIFTAAARNLADVKALICFELQYMNDHLAQENKSLKLGREVIPLLLRQSVKVAIIGRRKDGWEAKYLPKGVDPGALILLPDDAAYPILTYGATTVAANPAASAVLARRYSRLLHPAADAVIRKILSEESEPVDFASIDKEARIDEFVAKQRKAGLNDEQLLKKVFTPNYNNDPDGGFFTHNFIISGGQQLAPDGAILKFFHQALDRI